MDDSFYRDIAETSVDGLWVIGLDGSTRYANPALAAMFGASVEEFCRLTVFDTLDAEGCEQFRAHLVDLREGRSDPEPVEVLFCRRDGSALWTLVSEKILRDPDGGVLGVLHRVSDNDGRRRRMDELDESRRQLAEAHSIARLGSWSLDVASGRIKVSEHLREFYGFDGDDLTLPVWLDSVHDEDRAEVRRQVDRALEDGTDFDFLARVRGRESWIWTRGRGVAHHDADGAVVSLAGTHQDVTSHKETEEALEHQLERNALLQVIATAANEARTLADAFTDLRATLRTHKNWRDVSLYLPAADGVGVATLGPEDDPHGVGVDVALRTLEESRPTWNAAGTVLGFPLSFKGHVQAVAILVATTPPLDRAATATAVGQAAAQLVRVIEREHAERQLAAARDAALRASQAKSEFLAVMSHEIRTPLNGVLGLNELLLKTPLAPRQRQLATGVRDAGRSLLRLINDVLDLSKIEAGHLELERVDFDVRDVCDQAVGLMSDAARRKRIELAVACHPDVPEILAGDPTRLGQVIANLVSNAVKFTETGHVLVDVTCRRAGRRVELRVDVRDSGIGVSHEAQERIFEDFAQADVSTTRIHGGTGLGLSISRRIVEALEGALTVSSEPGEGSTFSFTAVLDTPLGSRTSPDDDLARSRLSGARVLVLSDDERRGGLLLHQLALWRARTDLVLDGARATAAIAASRDEEDPYEAVIVDVPAAHPREARAAARLIPQADGLRVFLVLTQRPDAFARDVQEGHVQVLTKPVSSATLRDALVGLDERVPQVSATTAALVRRDRPRILVVEDNPVNQMVATGMLESLGYDVELAEDGLEGVEAFDPDRHDAVLMDLQMPRMDGYAATRTLRSREQAGRRTPILAMTATTVDGERQRCLDAGMDDFLTKPVDLNHLGAALVRWLPTTGAPDPGQSTRAGLEVVPVGAPAAAPPTLGVELRPHVCLERLEMLREMDPGPDSYLVTAIDNFLAHRSRAVHDVRRAADDGDRVAASAAAHGLVGSALNVGLVRLGEAARDVELWDPADGGPTDYADLLDVLEAALEPALEALAAYRSGIVGGDLGAARTG